jgi:HEAT repeat protein
LGTNGATALLSNLHGTERITRLNVASVLERINDPRLIGQLDALMADPQPEVRAQAIYVAMNHWNSGFAEKLIGLLRDPNREIRHEAASALRRHRDELSRYTPVFWQMLQDSNLDVRVSGMKMLWYLQVSIPREQLLQFFKVPDREAISLAFAQLRNTNDTGLPVPFYASVGITDTEALPLLQNTDPFARLIGLKILYQNAEKQSVELALPLLKDPELAVRMRAAATLRALTGRPFTEDHPDQWEKWWAENKTNFVVELHPEELRPKWSPTNLPPWLPTNRPPRRAENPPR